MKRPYLVQRCELSGGRLSYNYMGSSEFEAGDQPKSLKRIFAAGITCGTVTTVVDGREVVVHLVAGNGFSFEEYQPHLQALANSELRLQECIYFDRALKQHLGIPLRQFEHPTDTNVWFDFGNDVLWVLSKNRRRSLVKWITKTVSKWLAAK